jgi:hypothetical protein
MSKPNLSVTEKFILVLVLLVLIPGFYLFFTDVPKFEQYVQEDGIAEWLTVLGLLLGSFVCFGRFAKLLRKKSSWFLFVTVGLGLFLFFAAGEEISWGQRIFGIETPEYFKANNAQQETNLHNLVVGGVKLNKLIFSVILVSLLSIFLVVVPFLYQRVSSIKKFLDNSAVPVAQWYQVIGFILVFVLTSLINHGKNAELLECGGALLFFLIVRYPRNKEIFSAH